MKREKNYKTARLIEALEYIDVRFIEEAAEKIKPRPTGQAFYGKPSRSKALRQFLALAACVLLLSAAIPAITYLANHLPDIVAFFIGDETTDTDPELTHPETPSPETTVPSPETTEETTEVYHETTEEPWPSTTAPREETASPEETTAEETASPPEPEYDGSVGLEYSIGGNAEIGWYMTLDGIGTCTDVDIVVASYYKGYPVKYIEQGAFYGQTQIKSIRLSGTVERIDSQAFRNCTSLESIYIGSGFREFNSDAFWGCGNISKIEIDPDNKFFEGVNCIIEKSRKALVRGCRTTVIPADGSVTRIDGLAFIDVHGLTSITIPEGVTSLGEDAFSGCPDLKSIHFSSTVNSFELVSVMGCDALEVITVDPKNPRFYSSGNCVIEKETGTLFLGCGGSVIPNDGSIKKIGYYAFGGNGSLVSVTVPEGVTYIDGYAFASCESLKSVYLPDSLITLGYGVFYHSSALENVKIGKNLEIIGSSVFDGCSKLNNLSLPKTLKRIGEMVFMECKSLASVSFEGTGAEWKAIEKVELWNAGAAFSTVHCSDGDLELYEYDGSRGLLYVQYGSYAQLSGIGTCTDKNIVIASAYNGVPVVIIEDGVFKSNKNIRSLTIPDKVHYIGKQAFAFCTSLESVVLPENLKTLGADAFNGCVALTEFTFKGTKAEWNAIEKQDGWNDGCPFTVIHCSDGDLELYEYDGSRGLEYRIEGDHAVLVGIGTCTDKDIAVATKYNAFPVTKIDAYALYDCQFLESIAIPEGVTVIGNEAFYLCKNLKNVTLPSTLEYIQDWAFANCESLENIFIPDSVKWIGQRAFSDCAKLSSVTLGQGLEQIQGSAFHNCAALKSVRFPRGLKLIEADAFSGCTSLADIAYAGTVSEWNLVDSTGEGYYYQSFTWHKDVPAQKIRCSDGDVEIKSVTPESDGSQGLEYKINDDGKSATLIGMGSCKDKDVVVASSYKGYPVTDIRYDAFAGSWITSVTLSDSVIRVDYSVFMNCYKNLKQIHISKSVLEFGHDAFSFLQNLESITVSPENPRYYVAGNCLIDRETKEVLRGWGDFTIPDDGSVTSIAEGAFSCCNIVNVVLPKGITKIDSSAFAFCASLKRISLPEGLLTIGDGSFDSCTSLESITLPDSLTKIDSGAFAYCENLSSIKIGRHIERIEKEVFYSSAVKDIQYAGTMSEWNSIKKPDNWNYNCFATVIHCSDGDVLAEPISYDEATELARQYWSPIESGYFVCYASYEMYLLVRPDEVIVDRIYIDRYTGEISVPKLTYPDIPDSLLKVLLNETTYIRQFDYESEGYFKDTVLDYPTAETGSFGYAVCDLDGDGKAELILSSMQYEIVLREFEGKVYGYLFDFRSLLDLKTDGSFNFISNAGMTYGTARLSFDSTKYVYHELTRRETADDGSISYFVDDKKVTKEEFDAREALLSQEEAPYEHLAIYPLRSWFPGG